MPKCIIEIVMKKERYGELDTLKFILIFLIYTFHFISDFKPEYLEYIYSTYPISIITYGITGKLCTAVFGVLLGYFAYNSSKNKSFVEYSIKRYGYFVWVGLFINVIFSFLYNIPIENSIIASFKVSDEVFPALWFARPFLIASIIANYLGRSKPDIKVNLIFILIFIMLGEVWIAVCLMGTLIGFILDSKVSNNRLINIIILIIYFILIKRNENTITFLLDGVFSVVLVVNIEKSKVVKQLFSNKITSALGKNTMAILVIHSTIHKIVGGYLFNNYFECRGMDFIYVWIICLILVILVSYPVTYLFDLYGKLFDRISYKFHCRLDGTN